MIDKSIRQYYQEGKKVNPLLKMGEELMSSNKVDVVSKYIDDKVKTMTPQSLIKSQAKSVVTKQVAKQLGLGSLAGPVGWLLGWLFNKAKAKVTGKTKEKALGITSQQEEGSQKAGFGDIDFGVGSSGKVSFAGMQYDEEHGAGAYKQKTTRDRISNIVRSGSTSDTAIDKINKLAETLDYEYDMTTGPTGDTEVIKDIITERPIDLPEHLTWIPSGKDIAQSKPTKTERPVDMPEHLTYTPPAPKPAPVHHHTGGGGGGGGGGGQAAPGTGASGPPGRNYMKGGRIDKPFTGRSRDI